MITTCPHCQTAFQLTAEQLSAKAGLVRCGACRQVFNGYHSLSIAAAPLAPSQAKPVTPGESQLSPANDVSARAHAQPASAQVQASEQPDAGLVRGSLLPPLEPTDASVPAAIAEAEALLREPMPGEKPVLDFLLDEPARDAGAATASGAHASPASRLARSVSTPQEAPAPQVGPLAWGDAPSALRSRRAKPAASPAALETERGLGRARAGGTAPHAEAAPARARTAEPLYQPDLHDAPASPGWWVGSFVLLALLAVQLTYFLRAGLAQHWPQTRGVLESVCARVGCEVPYARDLGQLNIESSTLEADTARPGVVLLQTTIQNVAPFVQRYPHLELTLTGVNDEVLGVKMLAPETYFARQPGGWQPQQSHALTLAMDVSALPPAGFRLRLVYP